MRLRRLFDLSEWRYLFKHRIGGWFQRANRGYADHDLWSFDSYLAEMLAGGMRRLASRTHGYPCDFPGGHEGWTAWLLDKAEWFDWYAKDTDGLSEEQDWIAPGISEDERRKRIHAYQDKMRHFFDAVLPDFVKHFGALWD